MYFFPKSALEDAPELAEHLATGESIMFFIDSALSYIIHMEPVPNDMSIVVIDQLNANKNATLCVDIAEYEFSSRDLIDLESSEIVAKQITNILDAIAGELRSV